METNNFSRMASLVHFNTFCKSIFKLREKRAYFYKTNHFYLEFICRSCYPYLEDESDTLNYTNHCVLITKCETETSNTRNTLIPRFLESDCRRIA